MCRVVPTWDPKRTHFMGMLEKVKGKEKGIHVWYLPSTKEERERKCVEAIETMEEKTEGKQGMGWKMISHLSFVLRKGFKMRNKEMRTLIYAVSHQCRLFLRLCSLHVKDLAFSNLSSIIRKILNPNLFPNGRWCDCFAFGVVPKQYHPCEERFTVVWFYSKRKCKWGNSHGLWLDVKATVRFNFRWMIRFWWCIRDEETLKAFDLFF